MIEKLTVIYYVAKVFVTLFEYIRKSETVAFESELRLVMNEIRRGATIDEKRNAAKSIADLIESGSLRKSSN